MLIRIITVLLIFNSISLAAGLKETDKNHPSSLGLSIELFGEPFLKTNAISYNPMDLGQDLGISRSHYKSPPKGMFLSLLIPGSGEFYAGSKLKGLLFIGVEVGAWVAFAYSQKMGTDFEKIYIQLADNNWSRARWDTWWQSLSSQDQGSFLGIQLPATKNRDYYEAIGIYEKFNAGWKDAEWNIGEPNIVFSSRRTSYMSWREASNSWLKWSTVATSIVMANHLLSALDAAWSVFRYNKNVKPAVKVKYVFANPKPQLLVGIQVEL